MFNDDIKPYFLCSGDQPRETLRTTDVDQQSIGWPLDLDKVTFGFVGLNNSWDPCG